eukprot:1683221-Pleurochrysis_carterae.AAC.1
MEFGDRREHTANGVRTRAGKWGRVAKGVTAKRVRGLPLTLLRRQTDPLKQELSQWGHQKTE